MLVKVEEIDNYQTAIKAPPIIREMAKPTKTPIQTCHLRRRRRAASSTTTCLMNVSKTETMMAASVVSLNMMKKMGAEKMEPMVNYCCRDEG